MEFFGCCEQAQGRQGTLLLPALSIGNVGQLAVDLLVSSLKLPRIGYLDDPYVLPCVGNDPFGPKAEGRLAVALELYGDSVNDLTILQQRSLLLKGATLKFSENLAQWAKNEGFQQIIILSGLDSGKRHIYDSAGPQVHYISSANEDGKDDRCEQLGWKKLQQFPLSVCNSAEFDLHSLKQAIEESSGLEDVSYFSKLPVTALFSACRANGLNVLCLFCYCAEGDNVPDAFFLANALDRFQHASDGKECKEWRVPLSWSTVYGPPPDRSIY